tara:strand:- start:549 stop:728 length:180 start_codon:yes stop_codon:yes gene_type:complete
MMSVLLVNPFAYLPYAFFNLLTPLFAVLWAYLNIGQAPVKKDAKATSPSAKKSNTDGCL